LANRQRTLDGAIPSETWTGATQLEGIASGDRLKPGGMVGWITADQGIGMKWRVIVELTGNDGTVRSHEVNA
jgi:hypothetical protein